MKILFSEIFRVYKKAPIKITFIWLLDVLESLIKKRFLLAGHIDNY